MDWHLLMIRATSPLVAMGARLALWHLSAVDLSAVEDCELPLFDNGPSRRAWDSDRGFESLQLQVSLIMSGWPWGEHMYRPVACRWHGTLWVCEAGRIWW